MLLFAEVLGQNNVQKSIDAFTSYADMQTASVSFQVIDLETGTVLASHDPNRTMPTASTAKLFATATALEVLGEDYRARTRLYHDGTIDASGVLTGDLWIRGGGDPSLGSQYYVSKSVRSLFLEQWADSLLTRGITKIDGRLIADASEFGYLGAPNGWSWVDMGNYYGAGPSGLTIYDNLLTFNFLVPSVLGAKTSIRSISPEVPGMNFTNYVQASSQKGDNAYIYGAPYSMDRFATGTLPAGTSSFIVKGSLPDPERQFAHEFLKVLNAKGIEVTGDITTGRILGVNSSNATYSDRTLLVTHKGETVGRIIDQTNFRSINLFAEHLVCLSGYHQTGNGSTSSGLSVLENYWSTRFNTHGIHVNDGSGLSRMNAISAAHFVGLLKAMHKSTNAERFKKSLPVAGENGTMRNICKGQAAHGRMIAKSGSMTRIKSYAGYINARSGKTYAFALIVNDAVCSSSTLVDRMERVFNSIAAN